MKPYDHRIGALLAAAGAIGATVCSAICFYYHDLVVLYVPGKSPGLFWAVIALGWAGVALYRHRLTRRLNRGKKAS